MVNIPWYNNCDPDFQAFAGNMVHVSILVFHSALNCKNRVAKGSNEKTPRKTNGMTMGQKTAVLKCISYQTFSIVIVSF